MPQTRTPDAHFFTEVSYKGCKTVAITPDYSEVAKLSDLWLHPKQGTPQCQNSCRIRFFSG